MRARRAIRADRLTVAMLTAALCIVAQRPAAAQAGTADPCIYRDNRGGIVITDQRGDPRCRGAAAPRRPAPAPGRMRVTFAIAELVAMAHDVAERHGVDHRLVESLVEMESSFDPGAVSPKGAMGLMQLMPSVAARYGVLDPFDPFQNLDGGVRHLRDLLEHFGPDLNRVVAAYNAGVGAVERHGGIPPFDETRNYVGRVLYRYRQRVQGERTH